MFHKYKKVKPLKLYALRVAKRTLQNEITFDIRVQKRNPVA